MSAEVSSINFDVEVFIFQFSLHLLEKQFSLAVNVAQKLTLDCLFHEFWVRMRVDSKLFNNVVNSGLGIDFMHQSIPAAPIPPSPGNCGAFAQSVPGVGISKFCVAGGVGICLPGCYPRAFNTCIVSHSKSKHGGFYQKGPAVCHRLAHPSKLRNGQTCGGFLDFMH